jgi:hypothetical protein
MIIVTILNMHINNHHQKSLVHLSPNLDNVPHDLLVQEVESQGVFGQMEGHQVQSVLLQF